MGSGDLLLCSCFSVWKLLLTASPLEKGYPYTSQAPAVFSLEAWRGAGGRKTGSDTLCPRLVSCPPAAAGGEGQSSELPAPQTRAFMGLSQGL